MGTSSEVIYSPNMQIPESNDPNQLVIVPGKSKKRKKSDDGPLPKKKSATGGKKGKNYAKEKEKKKITKKMKRQLAAVQQRKAAKLTQEELFASLAEYQLDAKKIGQLASSSHMQDKMRSGRHNTADEDNFPKRLKTSTSRVEITKTIHQKEHIQENYYPTDNEDTDSDAEANSRQASEVAVPSSSDSLDRSTDCVNIVNSNDISDKSAVQSTANGYPVSQELHSICEEPSSSRTSCDVKNTLVSRKEPNTEEDTELMKKPYVKPHNRQRVLISRNPVNEAKRSQLPIYSEEVPIMEIINDNIVTIICGETGSGKTTQVPQFLYEAGYATDGLLIGITEPRRVAAISMAERVGEELGTSEVVSYQIRYEGTRTSETRILFMTDGVLMKEMESDVMLKKYSVIIIDEAHERSMYSDVLIGMLSRIAPLRAKTSTPLKLVIMSATLRLADFTQKRLFPVVEPKVVNVESRQYPVTVHFEKRTPENYVVAAFRKVCRIHEALPEGAILVFVSGQQEAHYLTRKLKERYPIKYDKDSRGDLLVRGSKKWKKKQLEDAQNLKLEDFDDGDDRSLTFDNGDVHDIGVSDAVWDYEEGEENEEDWAGVTMSAPSSSCSPLYCLPLFSLLSSEKQRRVFAPPPEGTRLCVIATNVAETSLTIPGVKYVVDTGFEKRRLYDPVTGVSKFVIKHVSQASADQRAGRAGRVVAGHAYRAELQRETLLELWVTIWQAQISDLAVHYVMYAGDIKIYRTIQTDSDGDVQQRARNAVNQWLYSSAVYQSFDKYSRPEILDKPADQLFLHLKSMNIVKVVNFPFPSSPDADSLEAAEERLIKLGALARTAKNGKVSYSTHINYILYGMGPPQTDETVDLEFWAEWSVSLHGYGHSKDMKKRDVPFPPLVEARITSLGKTLSLFPLAPAYAKVVAMANQHSLMPYAILLIAALSVREPLVSISSIRGETDEDTKEKMTATLKLRRSWCGRGPGRRLGDLLVLMKAVIYSELEGMSPMACENLGLRHKAMLEIRRLRTQLTNIVNTSFKTSMDVVMDPALSPPSDAQCQMLRQMIVAGLADRIARRVDRSASDDEVPKGAYQTIKLQEFVFIDPCSVIYTEEPDYVVYQEIVQLGDRKCMQCVMMVDHEWLPRLAEPYCSFSPMDSNTEPRYDAEKDEIVKPVEVTFGPLEWRLDPVERPIPNDIMLYRYFAQFLLAGEVMPMLAAYVPHLLAPPTTMIRSWARLQKRTESLLNSLVLKDVHTKLSLVETWHKDENYLLEEYLDWLPESLHGTITVMWPPLEKKSSKMGRNKIYSQAK